MPEETPFEKPGVSRWSWFWIIALTAIVLTVGLQKCGVNVIKQTEDSEIIHKPHQ